MTSPTREPSVRYKCDFIPGDGTGGTEINVGNHQGTFFRLFYKKLRIGVSPSVYSIVYPFRGLKVSYEFLNFGIFWQFSR